MSTKQAKVENTCTGIALYIGLDLDAKNCRKLLHMHTRTCMCGALYDLLAPPPPAGIPVHTCDVGSMDSNGTEHLRFENAIALL